MSLTSIRPSFLYGTAWKNQDTERLARLALEQGFRGIDTANQLKHYYEAGVGQAIAGAIRDGLVAREDLFVQTKFTFQAGQDHRLPYDPAAAIAVQVLQSAESSLKHLQLDYVDSYVLHGPSRSLGLGAADWDAWGTMERLHDRGLVRSLGVSNVSLEQLTLLVQKARIRPSWVQNRCFAVAGWDREVRTFCHAQRISYQGFSLLTANANILKQAKLLSLAAKYRRGLAQIVFRFAIDVGMLPITGTTNASHMRDDLQVFDFQLTAAEVMDVENIATPDI